MEGPKLGPLGSEPSLPSETRTVDGMHPGAAFRQVSRRKMSLARLLSPGTKLLAKDSNTMKRPRALTDGCALGPLA